MIEKLDFLVRFWELKARHATLGEPLGQDEQRELLSLLQLVTGDMHLPDPCAASITSDALPAQVIGEGTLASVEIRAVMAAALVVTSATPFHVGAQVIVRCTDAVHAVEYALPCRVAWIYPGTVKTIAFVVDGIPTRSTFDGGVTPPWMTSVQAHGLVRWPNTQTHEVARRQ